MIYLLEFLFVDKLLVQFALIVRIATIEIIMSITTDNNAVIA